MAYFMMPPQSVMRGNPDLLSWHNIDLPYGALIQNIFVAVADDLGPADFTFQLMYDDGDMHEISPLWEASGTFHLQHTDIQLPNRKRFKLAIRVLSGTQQRAFSATFSGQV